MSPVPITRPTSKFQAADDHRFPRNPTALAFEFPRRAALGLLSHFCEGSARCELGLGLQKFLFCGGVADLGVSPTTLRFVLATFRRSDYGAIARQLVMSFSPPRFARFPGSRSALCAFARGVDYLPVVPDDLHLIIINLGGAPDVPH